MKNKHLPLMVICIAVTAACNNPSAGTEKKIQLPQRLL